MPKLLLPLVAFLAIGGSAAGASVYLLTRDDTVVEALPSPVALASPTPALTASPTAVPAIDYGGDFPASVVPPPSRTGVPFVPDDWATFQHEGVGETTFRYPGVWRLEPGTTATLISWDAAAAGTSYPPPGGVRVDFDRIPLEPSNAIQPRPKQATDTTLGGLPGWEIVWIYDNPGYWGRVHFVAAERGGFRYVLRGSFAEKDADEMIFSQILQSFHFIH